jgi:hypothetical protein
MTDTKKLNRKIDALGKRTAKWRDDVQLILVECAQHAYEGNNVDPCTRLVKAVHGADMVALVRWIEAHMPAYWVKSENKFRFNKSFLGEYDAISLMAEPWWNLAKKAKEVSSSLDVLESLRGFLKRMEKEATREIDGQKITVEHAELIGKLAAIANAAEYK